MLVIYNPLAEPRTRQLQVPLYYTGLTGSVAVDDGQHGSSVQPLDNRQHVRLDVAVPAGGFRYFVFSKAASATGGLPSDD